MDGALSDATPLAGLAAGGETFDPAAVLVLAVSDAAPPPPSAGADSSSSAGVDAADFGGLLNALVATCMAAGTAQLLSTSGIDFLNVYPAVSGVDPLMWRVPSDQARSVLAASQALAEEFAAAKMRERAEQQAAAAAAAAAATADRNNHNGRGHQGASSLLASMGGGSFAGGGSSGAAMLGATWRDLHAGFTHQSDARALGSGGGSTPTRKPHHHQHHHNVPLPAVLSSLHDSDWHASEVDAWRGVAESSFEGDGLDGLDGHFSEAGGAASSAASSSDDEERTQHHQHQHKNSHNHLSLDAFGGDALIAAAAQPLLEFVVRAGRRGRGGVPALTFLSVDEGSVDEDADGAAGSNNG